MNPPANWYPDPTGRHGQRYWDGEQWTEHVFTDGVQGVDPLDAAGPADQGSGAATDAASADADQEASGLFADAGDASADTTDATEPDADETGEVPAAADTTAESTWAPDDHAQVPASDDEDVAPEVEAADVVGSLDEVAEAESNEDASAAATVAPQEQSPTDEAGAPGDEPATQDEQALDDESAADEQADEQTEDESAAAGDQAPPAGDFSDAFMVTPETVSRLVSRQAASEPQQPDQAPPPSQDEERPPATTATEAPPDAAPEAAPGGGAIDAPPPVVPDADRPPAAASGGGLGISGELVGGAFAEREEAGPVALQNSRLLRCSLGAGSGVIARQGTMVAYQGEVSFERQGAGGVTRALKRAATGEGLAMMRAEGSGEVFFADGGQHVFLLQLEGGPGLSVNGRNVLAFSADLTWDIERVKGATLLAGGLFNTSLSGTGWVALVSDGEPVVLRTDEAPTHVDVNALVAWSGGLTTRITSTVSAKSLVGLGSGEAFQMAFDGAGIVIVQPSEGPTGGAAAT